MSSRDIDSTSENVLHDWARDEKPADEAIDPDELELAADEPDQDDAPAWGAAPSSAEPDEPAAVATETETEVVDDVAEDEIA